MLRDVEKISLALTTVRGKHMTMSTSTDPLVAAIKRYMESGGTYQGASKILGLPTMTVHGWYNEGLPRKIHQYHAAKARIPLLEQAAVLASKKER